MGEQYIPPEAFEFKIPSEKDNDSEQKKLEKPEQLPQQAQPQGERAKQISTELTPSEKQEKEQVLAEVKEGLAHLYELLPQEEKIVKKDIQSLINQTNLKVLSPPMKDLLAAQIARHELLSESKERLIEAGVGILELWIHTQTLGRAAPEAIHEI